MVGLLLRAVPAEADLLGQFIAPDVPGTDVQRDVTVLSRERPDYQALGVRLGDVMVQPLLTESAGVDDNVTGTSRPHGSALIETAPSLAVVYDHSLVSAVARVSVDDTRFLQQPRQSFTNWTASLGGTYELGRDTLTALYSHQVLNQSVQDLNVAQLETALPYQIDQLQLGYRIAFNRLFVLPALTVAKYTYENGMVGGAPYQQTFRNHLLFNPTVTTGYQLGPAAIIGVVRDAEARYTSPSVGAPRRDFHDVSALAGLDYDASGLLRYRLLVGYEVREFVSSAYKTIAAPVVEASVIWSPTGLTTITLEAARRIEDAADEATVGLTESALAVRVDHELLRNVLLQANAGYTDDEFAQGHGSQSLLSASLGASYLLNRNMRLSLVYSFSQRRSAGGATTTTPQAQQLGGSFEDNRLMLQLGIGL